MAKAKPDTGKGIAVVVAGMHRSGTSSLTKVLSAFGYALPKTLLAASSTNEKGFWESSVINRLNDKIFEYLGSNWRSWDTLPTDWGDRPSLAALKNEALETLKAEFETASSIILKDPRLSRLMPFWYPVLRASDLIPVVICPIRNPIETAASLEQRNGLPQAIGLLIWLRYQLDLEFDTRGNRRSFTHYNMLLNDWLSVINKIKLETGVPEREIDADTTKELGSWLSPKLRHHQFTDAAALHDTTYPKWVRAAYAIFLKWSQIQEEKSDYAELDHIRNEFNSVPDSLRGILDIGQNSLDDARRLRKKLDNQESELAEIKRQNAQRDAAARVYEEQFARAQSNVESTMQRWAQQDSAALLANERLQESKAKLAEAGKRQNEFDEKLKESELKLAAYEHSLKEAQNRNLNFENRIEEFLCQLAQKEAEARIYSEQNSERQKSIDSLSNSVQEFKQKLTERDIEFANLEQKLAQIEQQRDEFRLQLAQKETEARIYLLQNSERESYLERSRNFVQELQQQISAREIEFINLEQRLSQIEQQREETRLQLAQKETEARIHLEQSTDRIKALNDLENLLSELQLKLSASELENSNKNDNLAQVEQLYEQTRIQLAQKDTEANIYNEQNVELRHFIEEKIITANNLQNQLLEREKELANLGQRHIEIEQQRDKALHQLAQKEAEAQLYSIRYIERQKTLEEQIRIAKQLQQDLADKSSTLVERDQKLARTQALLNDIQRQLEQKQVEASVFSQQNLELQGKLEEQIDKENELKLELLELDATLTARNEHLSDLLEQHQDVLERLEQKTVEANDYYERNLDLQLALDEQSNAAKEQEQLLQEREAEIIILKQAYAVIEKRHKDILNQLVLTESEAKLCTDENRELLSTLATLTNRFNEQALLLATNESSLAELNRNLAEAASQHVDLLKQLSEKTAVIQKLSSQADIDSRILLDSENRILALKSELQSLQLLVINKEQEIEKISTELDITLLNHAARLSEIESRFALAKKEADTLKLKLIDTRKKRDTTIDERELAKRKIARLESELNNIRHSRLWKMQKSIAITWERLNAFLPTKSGRRLRLDVETIKSSPLFDGNWYLERYPDITRVNMDPALHYLKYGANEGRNPGPAFNTRFYFDRYTDVARHNVNPLVHYERFGRNENRRTEVADKDSSPVISVPQKPAVTLQPSTIESKQSRQGTEAKPSLSTTSNPDIQPALGFSWLSQADLLRLNGQSMLTLGGMTIARASDDGKLGNDFPSVALASLHAFICLNSIPTIHGMRLRLANETATQSINTETEIAQCNVHAFADFPIAIESIWYPNNRDLRIRINSKALPDARRTVIRGYQYISGMDGGLAMVGEHAVSHSPFELLDFALINPYLPVLLVLNTPDAHLLSATLLPFPSLCPGGAHESERFAAHAPSRACDLATLAHSLLTEYLRAADTTNGWALARIRIDIREATGAERIFSSDIKQWLWNIFALKPEIWNIPELDPASSAYWREIFELPDSMLNSECIERQGKRSQLGGEMICPPAAIPSIHALTTGLTENGLQGICKNGSYIVSQIGDSRTRWLVDMPISACTPERSLALAGCVRHPFIGDIGDTEKSKALRIGAPIALLERDLRPRHASQLIMPVAPEIDCPLVAVDRPNTAGKVSVVITTDNLNDIVFAAMLESLQLQQGIEIAEILVAVLPQPNVPGYTTLIPALQHYFPQKHHLLECNPGDRYVDRVQRAAALAPLDDVCLLFINRPIVLNDTRLLDTLTRLLLMDHVATSSCMLYSADPSTSAHPLQAIFSGLLPIRKPGMEQAECIEFDAQALFPLDAYPVASAGDGLFMIRAALWRSMGGFAMVQSTDQRAVIELSMKLAERGMSHLMTTLVSAEEVGSPTARTGPPILPSTTEAHALRDVSTCIEVMPS